MHFFCRGDIKANELFLARMTFNIERQSAADGKDECAGDRE